MGKLRSRQCRCQYWNKFQYCPAIYWKQIFGKQRIPYLRDSHNNKLHTAPEKEQLFRNHWGKIFSGDDDDNNDFDYDHITGIENHLNDDFEQIRTYDYGALYRLDRDFPPITIAELTITLRTFK